MADESSHSPLSIQPKFVFGLQLSIKGNVHFTAKNEVIYPVAGVIAIHDFESAKQKFLRLSDGHGIDIIAVSPNKKLLAVSVCEAKSNKHSIEIFSLTTLRRKKILKFPKEVPVQRPECLEFTRDSNGLTVLSKEPDAFLTIFYFDKTDTVIVGRVSNSYQKGLTADVIATNLSDNGLVVVGGMNSRH